VPAQTSLRAFFAEKVDPDRLVREVRTHLRGLAADGITVPGKVRVFPLAADDWAEAWPEYFVPIAVGPRLRIVPPWMAPEEDDRLTIVIDPGRGFGTGHHATTAGCLAFLTTIVERHHPGFAIDLGTGSGLLAIAAVRLGVERVVAVDDDSAAIDCAIANAARNGVADRMQCVVADAGAVETPSAPLVLANLLAPVHVRLAARYRELVASGGTLVLGGLLEAEGPDVTTTVEPEGFVRDQQLTIDGWTTATFSRTDS
jgi:ribosomal protein L11 methyltransferase